MHLFNYLSLVENRILCDLPVLGFQLHLILGCQ